MAEPEALDGSPAASRRSVLIGTPLALAAASARAAAARSRSSGQVDNEPGAATARPPAASRLSLGVTSSPRTWPIVDGAATIPGVDLAVTELPPGELFLRQLRDASFDASEMSISSLMIAVSRGDRRFIPLPIFTSRYMFHTLMLVRRGAGIQGPADLRGRRVGVPEYQMTGALWTRGVLRDEFGVEAGDISWWMERLPGDSHAGALGAKPPAGVKIAQIPADKNIGSMMLAGELDAAVMYFPSKTATSTERSTLDLASSSQITTLFPDPHAEGVRYYRKTGIFHINHCACIKRDVFERRPEIRRAVLDLFDTANDIADRRRMENVDYHFQTGEIDAVAEQHLAKRVVSHGVAPNRHTLETIARYSYDQGFTPRLVDIDAFFAPPGGRG